MQPTELKSPIIYFGGKSRAAHLIWDRFGCPPNYIESFCGSAATLLLRPNPPGIETINDIDGYVVNSFRAIKHDPEAVANWADEPVWENNFHAIHAWLLQHKKDLPRKLEGDPDWFDSKVAGWWLFGMSTKIGGGWCDDSGPWKVVNGMLINSKDADGDGIRRRLPRLSGNGQGVNRSMPFLADTIRGTVTQHLDGLKQWFGALSQRLKDVRITCGEWDRILGPSITTGNGKTAYLYDPPYSQDADYRGNVYTNNDPNVAHKVRDWCVANGDDPMKLICLCGYFEEHDSKIPETWERVRWHAVGGFRVQKKRWEERE